MKKKSLKRAYSENYNDQILKKQFFLLFFYVLNEDLKMTL
jgi:hypothetical protein